MKRFGPEINEESHDSDLQYAAYGHANDVYTTEERQRAKDILCARYPRSLSYKSLVITP